MAARTVCSVRALEICPLPHHHHIRFNETLYSPSASKHSLPAVVRHPTPPPPGQDKGLAQVPITETTLATLGFKLPTFRQSGITCWATRHPLRQRMRLSCTHATSRRRTPMAPPPYGYGGEREMTLLCLGERLFPPAEQRAVTVGIPAPGPFTQPCCSSSSSMGTMTLPRPYKCRRSDGL